ncbi:hypothetical protein CYLTODRAFT_426408 [Cylindrobasidium torrendii FP15055 ss-10]|uniref:Uncharacterized protein n=1 Tax=Cylindrobasidium torrendii FP15055 ss-10 TaxID=1314674 RepID=A0A0D7B0M2_9AGAR|nr:hypothetical protein CYLTODRAFT_426408 [Cylindrobasidium torrendii FP15055 ss-10]
MAKDSPAIHYFEYCAGTGHGEFQENVECSENYIPLQPRMQSLILSNRCAFMPSDNVLSNINALYLRNSCSAPRERIRFNNVPSLDDCVYTFECGENFTDRLFTRHPITGVVTTHIFPYPNLPQFIMPAHPCLVVQGFGKDPSDCDVSRVPLCPLVKEIMFSLTTNGRAAPDADTWRYSPSARSSSECPSLTYTSGSASSDESLEDLELADCFGSAPADGAAMDIDDHGAPTWANSDVSMDFESWQQGTWPEDIQEVATAKRRASSPDLEEAARPNKIPRLV